MPRRGSSRRLTAAAHAGRGARAARRGWPPPCATRCSRAARGSGPRLCLAVAAACGDDDPAACRCRRGRDRAAALRLAGPRRPALLRRRADAARQAVGPPRLRRAARGAGRRRADRAGLRDPGAGRGPRPGRLGRPRADRRPRGRAAGRHRRPARPGSASRAADLAELPAGQDRGAVRRRRRVAGAAAAGADPAALARAGRAAGRGLPGGRRPPRRGRPIRTSSASRSAATLALGRPSAVAAARHRAARSRRLDGLVAEAVALDPAPAPARPDCKASIARAGAAASCPRASPAAPPEAALARSRAPGLPGRVAGQAAPGPPWLDRWLARARPPPGQPALPALGGGLPADAAGSPAAAPGRCSISAPASSTRRCCSPASACASSRSWPRGRRPSPRWRGASTCRREAAAAPAAGRRVAAPRRAALPAGASGSATSARRCARQPGRRRDGRAPRPALRRPADPVALLRGERRPDRRSPATGPTRAAAARRRCGREQVAALHGADGGLAGAHRRRGARRLPARAPPLPARRRRRRRQLPRRGRRARAAPAPRPCSTCRRSPSGPAPASPRPGSRVGPRPSAASFLTDALPAGRRRGLAGPRRPRPRRRGGARASCAPRAAALPPGGTLLLAEPMAGTPGAEPVGDAYFGFYLLAMGSGRPAHAGRARPPAARRRLRPRPAGCRPVGRC